MNHVSIDVTQGEIVGLARAERCRQDHHILYDRGAYTAKRGPIFLNDLNITGFPVYKRAQNGIGYLTRRKPRYSAELSVEDNIRAVLQMTSI